MDPQVDKIMLGRKKNCPLLPKWAAIKGKHRAVANRAIFKTDLEPSIKAYDQAAQDYADAVADKQKLMDILQSLNGATQKFVAARDKLIADRNKNEIDIDNNKNNLQVLAYMKQPNADPDDVAKALLAYAASREASSKLHQKVVGDLVENDADYIAMIKGTASDYKAAADRMNAALQKAYDTSDQSQGDIIGALGEFIATADEIENQDLKKQLENFLNLVTK